MRQVPWFVVLASSPGSEWEEKVHSGTFQAGIIDNTEAFIYVHSYTPPPRHGRPCPSLRTPARLPQQLSTSPVSQWQCSVVQMSASQPPTTDSDYFG